MSTTMTRMKDKVAEEATELISSAAGAVADPRTGAQRAKTRVTEPKVIAAVAAAVVIAILLKLIGARRA